MQREKRPLRLLQVITDTDRRGAQVFASDLSAELTKRGHSVTTVALAPGSRSPAMDVKVLGSRPRGLRTLRALRQMMGEVDITIAHGSSTLLACGLAALGPGRPWVYRQISDSRFWASSRFRRLRVSVYLRAPAHVVALSPSSGCELTEYLRLPADRISVIPNGVPENGFEPATSEQTTSARIDFDLPADVFIAAYVGALSQEKGVDLAISAVADVEGTHLLVVGDGPHRSQLEALAIALAPNRVTFVGGLDVVSPAYAAANVLMLTSRGGDSMPAVLIEAGLCELPVITCPVGAIEDVVIHEHTGFVVPIDDQGSTTAALRDLVSSQQRVAELGRRAREHCLSHFTIEVVATQWIDALRRHLFEH